MISIARILGAPLSVPAGKTIEITSKRETSGSFMPNTSDSICIIFFTTTEPFSANFPMSLRAKSTNIRCSAHSLGSERSSFAKYSSSLASFPRGLEPAIGAM